MQMCIYPANLKMPTIVGCWHFNIYEQNKFSIMKHFYNLGAWCHRLAYHIIIMIVAFPGFIHLFSGVFLHLLPFPPKNIKTNLEFLDLPL